jgi:hypothetical protein
MGVTATIASTMATIETLTDGGIATSNNTVTHNRYDQSHALNSGTSVPITKCAFFLGALDTGAATIDLTALVSTNAAVISASGLKVQGFRVKNLGANAMTFEVGDSNGYELAGAAFSVTLAQGQHFQFFGNDAAPDVSGTAKTIDVSGTGSQTFECSILVG